MLIYLQNIILEMIARGEDLGATCARLCVEVERLVPGVRCSVLGVDGDGRSRPIARTVPADGHVGQGHRGIVRAGSDTPVGCSAEPQADGHRSTAADDVHACWSSPILSGDQVVGRFTLHYRSPRDPTEFEREVVAKCLPLCQLAIDQDNRLRVNERLVNSDALTGLANRASFEQAVAAASPGDAPSALMLIDIDDLKIVNDTFGHRSGDNLIRTVAGHLARVAAPHRAFRIGGDELAVLADTDQVEPLAHAIFEALRIPADCGGHMLVPSVTIGAALRTPGDEGGRLLRQNADLALYHGKEGGRGRLVLYDPELRTRMDRRLQQIEQLRTALAEGRVKACYQPIVGLETGGLVSFEALVRICQTDGGIVPAADFHEAFADARNAAGVTEAMLRAVAADLRAWRDKGLAVDRVAINLAPVDFADGRLVERIETIFGRAAVPLDRLTVEVTESVYLGRRDRIVQEQIGALRARGIKLALDDFGTGYASLTHLLFTPVDVLKIDKSFVDDLVDDGDAGGAVINGLMRIAEKLEIEVVAEGLESEEQRAQLVGLGCRLGQGHLFSEAMDPDGVERLLRDGPASLLPDTARAAGPPRNRATAAGGRFAARMRARYGRGR